MIKNIKLGKQNPLFVEFETDIMIDVGERENGKAMDIYFTEVEKGEIGKDIVRGNHKEESSDELNVGVAFRFHKTESIDAVIRQLEYAKSVLNAT